MSFKNQEVLWKNYYSQHFPAKRLCEWLSYYQPEQAAAFPEETANRLGFDKRFLARREFSFALQDGAYLRFKGFPDAAALQSALLKVVPAKVDVGAVYNTEVALRARALSFQPVQKEFVLDVDVSDYADVRPCCKEAAQMCEACWPLVALAVRVLSKLLRECFGFSRLLWVFSGRRGVHCWVCDARARNMSDRVRTAAAEFLRGYRAETRVLVAAAFEQLFVQQWPFWRDSALFAVFQKVLQRDGLGLSSLVKKNLQTALAALTPFAEETGPSSVRERTAWLKAKELCEEIQVRSRLAGGKTSLYNEVVFAFLYPRIDAEVSKKMNHLLKTPFSVHPSTGNVCVPFAEEQAEDFAFFSNCPNIAGLFREDGKTKREKGNNKKGVLAAVTLFDRFLETLLSDAQSEVAKIKKNEGLI